MRMGRASCNKHTVHVHSVLEEILPPKPKHFIWKASFLSLTYMSSPLQAPYPWFLNKGSHLTVTQATVLMLAEPVVFGGWIHGKSHIPGTHSQYLIMALLHSWLVSLFPTAQNYLTVFCDAHIQHIQLCRLSCTFLKLSCAKYQIQTSFGKHQGREKRKKTNPMTATYPMTQRLLSASCTDNISTHRYIFSDHTTHTYSSHDFWHGTNNTNGWNLSVIALTECQ